MSCRLLSPLVSANLFAGIAVLALSLLSGCGVGTFASGSDPSANAAAGNTSMGGILHGGPNPIIGAAITLYTTTSSGYGATANVVASTTTDSSGFFNLTLPTTTVACPTGEYAYLGAYAGSTGTSSNNTSTLLMVPIGSCAANYSSTGSSGSYVNTYNGPKLWIDELTTAVSAYALGNFMSIGSGGAINIGSPANNHAAASSTTPSAAGLAHAFANALTLINISTGQPAAYTRGGTSKSTGGVVPDAEIFLLGNILQACVNSNGPTGTNTSTSNDGSGCGELFSFTTPPQTGANVPSNTLQAMLNLVKYPDPGVGVATWNGNCTGAGTTNTTVGCLFNLAPTIGAYTGALTSAPPDFALAVVYTSGYGVQTASCTSTCPGLVYPYYVALDYSDNVYVLNLSGGTPTYTNILGFGYDGTPIFSSVEDTTNFSIQQIGTDTAGHVFGANDTTANPNTVQVYSTSTGAVAATASYNNIDPKAILADPFNNVYIASTASTINLRKLTYTASPLSYSIGSATTIGPANGIYQIGIDPNLDIYELEQGSSTIAYIASNTNSSLTTAPTFASNAITVAVSGSSTNAAGIGVTSANNAIVIDANGATVITKSGAGSSATLSAGTQYALPAVTGGVLYNRYVSVDGNNWLYSPDGANGSSVTGVSVFDSVDKLALGTYKGCYVSGGVCGTTASVVPMYSPRGMAIDSSGDIWVVSGASANLTELIGAAAPSWPGLSMAKAGLPQ